MALVIGPRAVRAQALYHAARFSFLWFVVLCAAVPEFFQRDRELLQPPTAVVVVLFSVGPLGTSAKCFVQDK